MARRLLLKEDQLTSTVNPPVGYKSVGYNGLTFSERQSDGDIVPIGIFVSDIIFTIDLVDALTVDFYAPYNLKINTVTDIVNTPTTTILDDGVSYNLTDTIVVGSEITVTVDTAAVVNLNIVKA